MVLVSPLSIDGMFGAHCVITPPVEVKLRQGVVAIQRAPGHGGVADAVRLVLVAVAVVVEVGVAGDLLVLIEVDGGATMAVVPAQVNGRLPFSSAILGEVILKRGFRIWLNKEH